MIYRPGRFFLPRLQKNQSRQTFRLSSRQGGSHGLEARPIGSALMEFLCDLSETQDGLTMLGLSKGSALWFPNSRYPDKEAVQECLKNLQDMQDCRSGLAV